MNHKWYLIGGTSISTLAVVALLIGAALPAHASDVYKFTLKGNVTEVDKGAKTITIYPTSTSAKAQNDLAGTKTEFNVAGAKFYKYDSNGKKVRTTIGNVPVGNEVVASGAKRANGNFNISELTVNSNTFSLVGTLKDFDTSNKTMTVTVSYTTYKSGTYLNKDVKIYYGSNMTVMNDHKVEINSDEVSNNSEKVKVTGTVGNGWKFEALTMIDGYAKAK